MASTALSMTPFGMAANAIGGLFGGGDTPSDNEALMAKLDEVILAINGMEVKMDAQKVGEVISVTRSFKSQ